MGFLRNFFQKERAKNFFKGLESIILTVFIFIIFFSTFVEIEKILSDTLQVDNCAWISFIVTGFMFYRLFRRYEEDREEKKRLQK